MARVSVPVDASVAPPRIRGRRRAFGSLLLIAWFPFAVALLPVVGSIIGLTGDEGPIGAARWAILMLFYFAPFTVGAALGWSAIRARLRGGLALVAWLGLVGNLAIILVSVAFAAGEVLNPH